MNPGPPPLQAPGPPSESKVIFWRNAMIVAVFFIVIPPILGLAGTVVGMFSAYNDLGASGMGDPKALSEDISFALITTVVGLVVSAVALFAFVASLVRYLNLRKRYMAAS